MFQERAWMPALPRKVNLRTDRCYLFKMIRQASSTPGVISTGHVDDVEPSFLKYARRDSGPTSRQTLSHNRLSLIDLSQFSQQFPKESMLSARNMPLVKFRCRANVEQSYRSVFDSSS